MEETRKTKMSKEVRVVLVSGLAAILIGCSSKPDTTRLCVDKNKIVTTDDKCEDEKKYAGTGGGGAYVRPYNWYYVGGSDAGKTYTPGTKVGGGTYIAPVKSSGFYNAKGASVSVARGGFGGTAKGISAGIAGG